MQRGLRKSRCHRGQDESGFTLIEVLVAFAVLALGLTVLVRAFGLGFQAYRAADGKTTAVQLAQSKLATVGLAEPILAGRKSGTFENGYQWVLDMAPLGANEGQRNGDLLPYSVTVTITVPGLRGTRVDTVSLTTVKLGRP